MKSMRVWMALALSLALRAVGADTATNAAPAVPGEYMVVDLSGGSSASRYPVSVLDAMPAGGWTDEYKTTKLVFRRISAPDQAFLMGSPLQETGRQQSDGRHDDETLHAVTLTKTFYIGVFPVTQRQWELVMGNRPSYFNNATYYACRPVEQVSYEDIRGADDGARWPASPTVDRSSFLGVLRKKTDRMTFDLPTEAQWEYACRAGTTTALNSGQNLTSPVSDQHLDPLARYWSNSRLRLRQGCAPNAGTALVGSYLPNDWGLYDMHGNVWEWCLDWYGSYPETATDPLGATAGQFRVLRGGSWSYGASYCRSAYRYYYGSCGTSPSLRCYDFGFRVALTLP